MDWKKLSHLPAEKIQALQNKKLKAFIRHQIPYSPYYRQIFEKNNLSFSDFETTDDLVKLPFTTKEDLAPTKDNPGRPKQFMLQPDEHLIKKYAPKSVLLNIIWGKLTRQDVKKKLEWEYKPIHLHFTTGRTALPTPFGYSARDLNYLREGGARLFDVAGISHEFVAINGFPYSPHLAFWQAYHAMTKVGLTSLQTGGGKVMGTQKIMDAIERLKAQVIVFIPGYAYHLIREAHKQKKDFSNVKYLITGGERLSQGFRDKIREFLYDLGAKEDLKILSTYAMTESKTAWLQCDERSGYHLYPDLEFIEVIDKEGRRAKEGEGGEIVYTALDWRGSVVLRYKTGDLCKGIDRVPCPYCGRTIPRIRQDIQRSSEVKEFHLTKIKGELINLNNFYSLIPGVKEVDEWQIEITKKNNDPLEIDELTLWLAPKPGVNFDELKARLDRIVRNEMFISANIRKAELNELLEKLGMETELKEKRIFDNRPKDK